MFGSSSGFQDKPMDTSNPLLDTVLDLLRQGKAFTAIRPVRFSAPRNRVRFEFADGTAEVREFPGSGSAFTTWWKEMGGYLRNAWSAAEAFSVHAQSVIHGKWRGISKSDQESELLLTDNGCCEFCCDGDCGQGTYFIDWFTTPASIDIRFSSKHEIRSIIEINDDVLRLENVEPGSQRPSAFTDDCIELHRSEP